MLVLMAGADSVGGSLSHSSVAPAKILVAAVGRRALTEMDHGFREYVRSKDRKSVA